MSGKKPSFVERERMKPAYPARSSETNDGVDAAQHRDEGSHRLSDLVAQELPGLGQGGIPARVLRYLSERTGST
ncbi:MAG: hypothetical protein JW751_20480 [Polyangiaceae bacterium]|nr:hypothetical protein [Polyangiaceae bacterium]